MTGRDDLARPASAIPKALLVQTSRIRKPTRGQCDSLAPRDPPPSRAAENLVHKESGTLKLSSVDPDQRHGPLAPQRPPAGLRKPVAYVDVMRSEAKPVAPQGSVAG